MANQANYPSALLPGNVYQRPSRLTAADIALLQPGLEQVILGTEIPDITEIWIYNPDSTFAGHLNLSYNDPEMSLTTLIDTSGAYELVNIDLKSVGNALGIEPGRYGLVVNFFKDWVGSEAGYQLYIQDISDDRTELRLYPVNVTPQVINDITIFIEPSVPQEFADALIAEALSQSLNPTVSTSVNITNTLAGLNAMESVSVSARITYASASTAYANLLNTILTGTFELALDNLAADPYNYAITQSEIEAYVSGALDQFIYTLNQNNLVDSRFQLS